MDFRAFHVFVKTAAELRLQDDDLPDDYLRVHATILERFPELEKAAFDRKKFKEGLWDEGIPLTGATIGAALGAKSHNVLRGAALGYAVGGGASLARSYLKKEKPSLSRKLLAAGAFGYGAGGLGHGAIQKLTRGARKGSFAQKWFHPAKDVPTWRSAMAEEALPAAGATVATGLARGTHRGRDEDA